MSRFHRAWAGVVFALASVASAPRPAPADEPPALTLLVPAYFYPAGAGLKGWDRMIASAPKAPIVAIANPASGPGAKVDPNYTAVLDRATKASLKWVGYVSTRYAKRPLDEAKADIDLWKKLYPNVRGFFLDEQASGPDAVDYYKALAEHARATVPKALVITNPGTVCDEGFLKVREIDVVCVFEGFPGLDKFASPPWIESYPPQRFAALGYKQPKASAMQSALRDAKSKRIGSIYLTDRDGANPWDGLPAYWDAEVRDAHALNAEKR